MNAISLYELNGWIKQTLKERFVDAVWFTAEIAGIQENRSGHCYLELVDKREGEDGVVAMAKGTIWAFTYRMLKPYFETTTGHSLEKGMRVLLQAEVVFHELYGYSLNIRDVDPTFTVGDLERKKREILLQLEAEGIIGMNKELSFLILPKTVAIISSPTAAGLGDFMNQLANNQCGFCFQTKLFPAVMQGERTTDSVIAALDRIYEYESVFDVVVIIRGGGSQTDLGSFDTYDMAANVAQFPLPVIAGIGHERDETIVDKVAWMSVKTPTAAAAFLIESFLNAESALESVKDAFTDGVVQFIEDENAVFMEFASGLKKTTQTVLDEENERLYLLSHKMEREGRLFVNKRLSGFDMLHTRLGNCVKLLFSENRHALEVAEIRMRYADPHLVLERGYSVTRLNGKAVKSVVDLKPGDMVETMFRDGKVFSIINDNIE